MIHVKTCFIGEPELFGEYFNVEHLDELKIIIAEAEDFDYMLLNDEQKSSFLVEDSTNIHLCRCIDEVLDFINNHTEKNFRVKSFAKAPLFFIGIDNEDFDLNSALFELFRLEYSLEKEMS